MAHVDDGEFVTNGGVTNKVRIPSDSQYANAGDVRIASKARMAGQQIGGGANRADDGGRRGLCFEM